MKDLSFFKRKKISEDEEVKKKKQSDKTIKPRAPKFMAGKKLIRIIVWFIGILLLAKGCVAWTQGTRVVNQTIINGSTESMVSDSIKGFAVDFATEYFTWEANFTADRNKRLDRFIKSIEPDMGLKVYDVKSSSIVNSAEVYGTHVIDEHHIDITVVVWRTVLQLPDQIEAAQGVTEAPAPVTNKVYMVVPVTVALEGPVIEAYPRFISEQPKGVTVTNSQQFVNVGDSLLVEKGTDLVDSYLRSWYEGNAAQLKYFYADNIESPKILTKSDFTYDGLKKVAVLTELHPDGTTSKNEYRINADVTVKNSFGEPFTNSWTLSVKEKDGRLFILSNGIKQPLGQINSEAPGTENAEGDTNEEPPPAPPAVTNEAGNSEIEDAPSSNSQSDESSTYEDEFEYEQNQ